MSYEDVKRWRERHPDKKRAIDREYARKRKEKMTEEEKTKLREYNTQKQRERRAKLKLTSGEK